MGRAPCCDKANVKKGPWSPEEDAKLKAYIEQFGTGGNWIALPQKIGLKRCGKSCRLRWLNYLRPNIKHGGFSEEEDNIICNLYISIGSRWSIIAAQLPGRTDNDIKNYWNTRLKKKLLGRRKQSNTNRISSSQDGEDTNGGLEDNSNSSHTLSNSAMERLQLHMQLQSFQSPFFNNPPMWPQLHPFHEKMIQNFQNTNPNSFMQKPEEEPKCDFYQTPILLPQNYPKIAIDDSNNILKPTVTESAAVEPLLGFQNEIDEFDCFKEIVGSKENLAWWSNDDQFVTNSSSTNSWDSSSALHAEGMFQDYVLGYNL